MMRELLAILFFLALSVCQSKAQSPVYYFTSTSVTAIESNRSIIAGYVKTDTPPTVSDSVIIKLRSGSPRATHMDTTSRYVLIFNSGQDSVPFRLQLSKDTFPEHPENVLYVLTSPTNGASIATDSLLLFTLIDTTPPATISYLVDSMWCYDNKDSFEGGVYVPYSGVSYVGITVNNPNPFYVRYYANNYDCNGYFYNHFLTACSLYDYYFNGETCYAPPGISTYYKVANMVERNSTIDKHFICYLSNIDANIIGADSLVYFTIRHSNYFDTPSLSFDRNSITVVGDSFASVGIPITINNPNYQPLYFRIDTVQTFASYPGINYTFNDQEYGYGNGISHDTFWVRFINPHLTGDTISMTFALRNDSVNASADTLISITVVDTGSLMISFLGAGLSHLKSDSIGYVKVYTSSFAKYPISVDVSYLTGNAIRDTDFTFKDTTIVFPAFSFDTISLPVVMLQDHRSQGNTQVVLQLANVNPSNLQYGIIQYTYIIIDDEDSGLVSGVQPMNRNQNAKVYPNPFDNDISIETSLTPFKISITNSIGQVVYRSNEKEGNITISLADQPAGLYLVKLSSGDRVYTAKVQKL